MQRVSVIGNAGAGKSTLARRLAGVLGAPYLELDSVFHQAGWRPLPAEEFQDRVRAFVEQERWVVDGTYQGQGIAPLVWAAADTVVWLDLPRHVVMRQIIARSFGRVLRRESLWNGNRESLRNFFKVAPEENIILWSWTRDGHYRERGERSLVDGTWAGLEVHRLRARRDVERFLASAGEGAGAHP